MDKGNFVHVRVKYAFFNAVNYFDDLYVYLTHFAIHDNILKNFVSFYKITQTLYNMCFFPYYSKLTRIRYRLQ